jgi:chromate reductase, NAD(P)H dehydrogenase (quinone)
VEDGSLKILGLAGSLRRASFHRGLIRAAQELAPGDTMVEPYERLDEIPFFNQDVEDQGDPAPVKEFKEKIRQVDAILIATPEYDYAIPGVLTTALDWALRPPSPFRHKPVGIVGTSPGSVGTARGQMVLRQILLHPPAYVMPEPQMLIPYALERFDEQTGDLVNERMREMMHRFLKALVEWTQRFKMTVTAYERSK